MSCGLGLEYAFRFDQLIHMFCRCTRILPYLSPNSTSLSLNFLHEVGRGSMCAMNVLNYYQRNRGMCALSDMTTRRGILLSCIVPHRTCELISLMTSRSFNCFQSCSLNLPLRIIALLSLSFDASSSPNILARALYLAPFLLSFCLIGFILTVVRPKGPPNKWSHVRVQSLMMGPFVAVSNLSVILTSRSFPVQHLADQPSQVGTYHAFWEQYSSMLWA